MGEQQDVAPILTTAGAARYLHVDRRALIRAVKRRELQPAFRTPGGRYRFTPEALDAYRRRPVAPVAQPDPVQTALERLAMLDTAADPTSLITSIMSLLAETLDVGLTFLSRVDATHLYVEHVCDRAGMGLQVGTSAALCDTYCQTLLAHTNGPLVVPDVLADPHFSLLPATHELGIGAYSGVPLRWPDGALYGTLCTLHPAPRQPYQSETALLTLAGRLIMQAVALAQRYEGERRAFAARQAIEETLRQSQARLRAVVTGAPIILFALDAQGMYTLSEGAALAVLGTTPGAAVGCSVFDAYRDYPELLDYMRQALAGQAVTFISRVRGAVFENRMVPVLDDEGNVQQVIGVSTDVTERTRASEELEESRRELERSNADLQQFAYVASHDLQEPLRTISSYLQLLKRRYQGRLDADADEFIGYAVDGARRMQELIKAVLDYSRVSTRAQPFAHVDCVSLCQQVIGQLQARIAESGATVTYGTLPVVLGDEAQLIQLVQNLVGNAIKFARPAVSPRVHISAAREGDAWLFRVADNGIGIAPEHAGRIFLMFQRLHTRGEYEGTGIGLSTCKKIVERHGGRIWVESAEGRGATFCFTLPAVDPSRRHVA